MITARLTNGTFILGITQENVDRLLLGQPIMVSLGRLGGTDDVAIMYGATAADILAELQASSGAPLPPPTDLKKEAH